MAFLRPPNVDQLKRRGDVLGLVRALFWKMKDCEGPARSVREAAAEALRATGAAAIPPLLDEMEKQRRKTLLMKEMGLLAELAVQSRDANEQQQVIDILVEALASKHIPVQVSHALSDMASSVAPSHHRQIAQIFLGLLEHEYDYVRREGAAGLADIGLSAEDDDLRETILGVLTSAARAESDQNTREVIANNLGRLRKGLAESALADTRTRVQPAAVAAAVSAAPEYLCVVFRDRDIPVVERARFCGSVIHGLFPEYEGKGKTVVRYEFDPDMPARVSGSDAQSYPYGMMRLMALVERLGMGKLQLGVRHNMAWSNFDDAHGGRGIVYVIFPWDE